MKKRFSYIGVLTPLFVAGSIALAGCTDSDYDLGDLDKTIAVGSEEGITLSGSSTSNITLDDLLDIDDSDCITTEDNGDYVFVKEGDQVTANPNIDQIDVTQQTSVDIPQKINVGTLPSTYSLIPVGTTLTGTGGQIAEDINTFDYEGGKPTEVVDLTEVTVDGNVTLTISFNSDLQSFLSTFTSFDIEFPSYMTIENTTKGTISGNAIQFGTVPTNQPLTFTADVTKLKFETVDAANLLAIDGSNIKMKGNVRVKATYPDLVKGSGDITNMIINAQTNISDIKITGAKGKFNPEIDIDDSSFDVTDVPDFLNDPDVNINIFDPQITLQVNSNVGVDAFVDATLTAYFKNGTSKSVDVAGISIPGNKNSKILVCRQPKTEPYGDYTQVKTVDNLSDLIQTIPEKITFKANAYADQTKEGEFKLGYNGYNITTDYEFKAKLELEAGSTIVYNDTVDGWAEDLEDLLLHDNAKVEATFDITNNVPAKLDLEATPIDANGKDIAANMLKIENPSTIGTGVTKGVKFTITQQNKDALKKLDGLRVKVKAISTGNTPLNKTSQTIKIENITVTVKGKVVFEDNDD